VKDIFQYRMEGILEALSKVKLYTFPTKYPWTIETFICNTWEVCCTGAQELNKRSQMVEVAVLELIELVLFESETAANIFEVLDDSDIDDSDSESSREGSPR
ncbi:unnamed protein product, partial [Meganyctiphanes norvegica]